MSRLCIDSKDIPKGHAVLLHGGGIDSTCLFVLMLIAGVQFHVVHVDYGQAPAAVERKFVKQQCESRGVTYTFLKAPFVRKGPRGLYKARNAFLISLGFTMSNTVYTGLTHECMFKDSSRDFLDKMQAAVQCFNTAARIVTPTHDWLKTKEVAFLQWHAPDLKFWTCNDSPGPKPCGKCSHCQDYAFALKELKTGKVQLPPKTRLSEMFESDCDI